MNARELFQALAALPGVRNAQARTGGIEETKVLAGLEVARVPVGADEQGLRKAWKARANGGEMPLTAVRELAEELERLDRRGIAGLVVNGLGTEYLYSERIRDSDRWPKLAALAEGVNGQWRDVVQGLGYEVQRRKRGYLARYDGKPVCVVLPLADPAAFSKLDPEGRPPEGLLVNACQEEGARYGLLAAGGRPLPRARRRDPARGRPAADRAARAGLPRRRRLRNADGRRAGLRSSAAARCAGSSTAFALS